MKQEIEDKVKEILHGIELDNSDDDDGWWETSVGVKFGKEKLEELLTYLETVL